jgi:hypothetical protein
MIPTKLKKKQNSYNTTGQLKRLATKESQDQRNQYSRTQVEEDYTIAPE